MKIIAISQKVKIEEFGEVVTQLDTRLFNYFQRAGILIIGIPFIVKNKKINYISTKKFLDHLRLDGLILSGGDDIGKKPLRDSLEYFLISYFKKKNKPILGICRGMQIIAKKFGSELKKINGHVKKIHNVTQKGLQKKVICYHNYTIKSCPKNFDTEYYSSDGCIESFISKNKKIKGIMWHPERLKFFDKRDLKEIKNYFK